MQGSPLALLDRGLDLTTAAGGMVAMNLVSFAQYERELIGERTKAGLAAKKRRGEHRTPAPWLAARIVDYLAETHPRANEPSAPVWPEREATVVARVGTRRQIAYDWTEPVDMGRFTGECSAWPWQQQGYQ